MSQAPFANYKNEAMGFRMADGSDGAAWRELNDWYVSKGKALFIEAFNKETSMRLPAGANLDNQIGAALPRSFADFEHKSKDNAFYRTHAQWFLDEMDLVVSRVPRESTDPAANFAYGNVYRYVQGLLMDSVVLFEHWGTRALEVPGVYGVGKNETAHLVQFWHGTRQMIYGHGSFGLSFAGSHSDLAVGMIRQAVELRLRRAFGVLGKSRVSDGSFSPVSLSELFDAIDEAGSDVITPVPLFNIKRVNAWANMFMHYGIKFYSWTPSRVLLYVRPLIVGGETVEGEKTVYSGVKMKQAAFDKVRLSIADKIKADLDKSTGQPRFEALLEDPANCDAVILND
jgi:hypothetical protein